MGINLSFTLVLPCLNEEKTLGKCIDLAKESALNNSLNIEIVVADNGSTDSSALIAKKAGVTLIKVSEKGYGAAIDAGIRASSNEIIVIADADLSYDLLNSHIFIETLIENDLDLLIGNRFLGGIEKGAMPPLHKFIGNPLLSWFARFSFGIKIFDFHCGMRALKKSKYLQANPRTKGMEFATESILRFANESFKIAEMPTKLFKDGRDRKPHLRSFPDGWRHLKLMFLFAPQFLLIFPGLTITIISIVMIASYVLTGNILLGFAEANVQGSIILLLFLFIGLRLISSGLASAAFAARNGLKRLHWWGLDFKIMKSKYFFILNLLLFSLSIFGLLIFILGWIIGNHPSLNPIEVTRFTIPAIAISIISFESIISAIQVRQTLTDSW